MYIKSEPINMRGVKNMKFKGQVASDVECYGEPLFKKGEWVEGYLAAPNVIVGELVEIDEECIAFEWWVVVDTKTVEEVK
ncbi:MAG: hypothetical protein PHE15_00075 [Dehalococcoidales bacterium]|nr:hypothetical protein [Dehalococcoidales bacterium]